MPHSTKYQATPTVHLGGLNMHIDRQTISIDIDFSIMTSNFYCSRHAYDWMYLTIMISDTVLVNCEIVVNI